MWLASSLKLLGATRAAASAGVGAGWGLLSAAGAARDPMM